MSVESQLTLPSIKISASDDDPSEILDLWPEWKFQTESWKSGDDVIIVPAVDNEAAKILFPDGWTTVKPYLRTLPDPSK